MWAKENINVLSKSMYNRNNTRNRPKFTKHMLTAPVTSCVITGAVNLAYLAKRPQFLHGAVFTISTYKV